ncbi:MAG: hypothetical protein GDA49_02585 [Rhodospirillales bacterium]|nr:hypothetical protein [Rhodospirillales bacterium]
MHGSTIATLPQLQVKGEFVGGCDIMKEMYMSGELSEYLEDRGVARDPAACAR